MGGEVEGNRRVRGAGGKRSAIAEVASDGFGTQLSDALSGRIRAGQGSHRPPFGDEPLHQLAADESRPTSDEGCLGHRPRC
jgi:hypothetical protein